MASGNGQVKVLSSEDKRAKREARKQRAFTRTIVGNLNSLVAQVSVGGQVIFTQSFASEFELQDFILTQLREINTPAMVQLVK